MKAGSLGSKKRGATHWAGWSAGHTLQPAGLLRLAMPGEVDHVRRRVDRGEELRDPHTQVAVHPVGDHL